MSLTNNQQHGLLAEFDAVDPLYHACEKIRDAGYVHWDAHTPFPVHGLDHAMGVKPTRLPWLILCCGLTGLFGALLLQWYTNAFDYPFRISGKPLFSLPTNIPVMFELTVLLSGFAAFFGSLWFNKLPQWYSPLSAQPNFKRATADRFFIYIERQDPRFNEADLRQILQAHQALSIEWICADTSNTALPKGSLGVAVMLVLLSLVPLALFAKARLVTSEKPRIRGMPGDMDNQYKFKPQASNWLFADGRAMRAPVEGVVSIENTVSDNVFYTGKQGNGNYTIDLPAQVLIEEQTMKRGKDRFMIYCAPCHGLSGSGDGTVARRAQKLEEGTWVMPSSLHDDRIRQMPVGEIFNTITHGIRSMPAYASQIDEDDRWHIIMYIRALQLSQHAPTTAAPARILPTLQ